MIRRFTFLWLLPLLACVACHSEFDAFQERAVRFGSDKTIDAKEWYELKSDVALHADDRSFQRFFTNGKLDDAKLKTYLQKLGTVEDASEAEAAAHTAINVYIENSGSMNGYINGNTEFKAAIQDLLVLLKYQYDEKNINLFFINSEIYATPFGRDLTGFASQLDLKNFKVGNTAASDLNNVFRQVLGKTKKDTMSILVSDCIYSIHGSKTQELLSNEKSLTKDAFLTKSKENLKLATTIVKLTSHFNGNYWDMNNKKTLLKNALRPYYITVIGDEKAMRRFNANVEFAPEKVKGYENKYVLTSQTGSGDGFYSVVNTEFDEGRYKISRDAPTDGNGNSIEDIEVDARNGGRFVFSIAADFSSVAAEGDYIANVGNYESGRYKILRVLPFDKRNLKPNSVNMLQKRNGTPTHLIVVEAPKSDLSDFAIRLKKQAPLWILQSSTEDDSDTKNIAGKTFGFQYLVDGISEAYAIQTKSDQYAALPIKIKK